MPGLDLSLNPQDTADYPHPRPLAPQILRDSLGKLKLNDAALSYEPEASSAMGFGFRYVILETHELKARWDTPHKRLRPKGDCYVIRK